MFDVNHFSAIQVGLASPEKIREWSYGEVKKPETINYRSQKPERDGLFCERIFGPAKDYECYCGKYKKVRYLGHICEKCGVEVTTKNVRRERMGHIELATPVAHIWYLKGIPSRMAQILDISPKDLEEVVYFISHIVLKPGKITKDGQDVKILNYREVLDEKSARVRFIEVIKEIQTTFDVDSSDYSTALELIDKIENPKETFDFYTYSEFIKKHSGAEFGIGAEAIKRLLEEVDLDKEFELTQQELKETLNQKNLKRQKLIKRLEIIEAFRSSNNKPEWMILDVLPVIPPDLRPMLQLDGGRFATSDLNDLYRRVITRNIRLKKLIEIKAPSVILMNEKRMLQEAVDALIDNGRRSKPVSGAAGRTLKSLSHTLKGKQGRFRQNLLGKRVDYSGRSVIAVGPDLKMYQCGIPREMAVQLFKPFIAQRLIQAGYASGHKAAEKLIEQSDERIWDIVEEVIKDHPVLLNRAPTLHRLGIQAFEPKLVKGRAIRLHPLVTPAFNADFDGDQMAVHVPLSDDAIYEARNLMLGANNILGPKDGKPIVTPGQDMVLGNYYLTLESSSDDFRKKAQELRNRGEEEKAEMFDLYAESEGKVFKNPDEAILAWSTQQIHLHNRIAVKADTVGKTYFTEEQNKSYLITTTGKLIFNKIFPTEYTYLNRTADIKKASTTDFVPLGSDIREIIKNTPLNKPFAKKNLGEIINEIFRLFGTKETSIMLDKLKDQGFKFATLSGVTVSVSDIITLENKEEIFQKAEQEVIKAQKLFDRGLLTNEERHNKVISIWEGVKNDIQVKLSAELAKDKRNPIQMMADSGARGNAQHFTQLSGMRGLMNNPSGDIIELPIKSSFREGLSVSEFFISTHGARKGGADTALKTAESGYLTRRLVDVAQDVIIREEDCHTDHGFVVTALSDNTNNTISKIESLADRLAGRFALRDILHPTTGEVLVKEGTMISDDEARMVEAAGVTSVEVRSLFGCESKDGICVKCYGRNLATGDVVKIGEAVGIMAAQSIGEPGTQLTMRTFHTGGVAGGVDITLGLPRVQELFEARAPKGEAIISEIAGEVVDIKEDKENGRATVVVRNNLEEKTYVTPFGATLRVSKGDIIENGHMITEGAINPKQLLEVADVTAVQRYILKEVQKVYRLQGIEISDKHIEVVVRQMLKKFLVIEGGDTNLLPGNKIDINDFIKVNNDILLAGKRPAHARPLLLGITKASLETDSFLSAASFQETTRVLTDAATKGKIDYLHGLKENVIIGKLIPAGTGFPINGEVPTLTSNVKATTATINNDYRKSTDEDDVDDDDYDDNDEE
jgi:DNA-directed RNA polymerase subunit beta'